MIQRVQFSVDLVLDFHPVNHYCIPSWDCQLPRNLAKSRGFFHCFKCTLPTAKHPHWCCWLHFLLLDVSISSKEEISWNKQLQPLQLNRGVHPGMANPEILLQTNCKSVLNLFLHCPYRLSWVQTMQKDLAEKGFSECPFFLAAQCLFDAGCTKHLLPSWYLVKPCTWWSWRCFPASVIPYEVTLPKTHGGLGSCWLWMLMVPSP